MGSQPALDLVGAVLARAAREYPDRCAYVYESTAITYREIDEAADRFAAALLRLGFRKGERLAINALNQPEWLAAYFGAARIGVVTVGLNVRYRDLELELILNQSETRAVLSLARLGEMDYGAFLSRLRPRLPSVRDYIFLGGDGFEGSLRFEELCAGDVDRAALAAATSEVAGADPVMIVHTAGATGLPKGAVITHRSQLAAARAQAAHTRLTGDDRILLPLPFNHVGGITCGVATALVAGASCVLMPFFDAEDVIEQARAWSPTIWLGVPTMHTLVLTHPRLKDLDTKGVRLVMTAGENAGPVLLARLQLAFAQASFMNLYGLSESSGALVMSDWQGDFTTTVKSIGRPIGDFECRVVDEHGAPVGDGRIGELQFRGDAIAAGYFRMPDESSVTFDEGGWLRTGDLGYRDEAGNLVLMGRLKDMYIQGGFNIYPTEVENLISRHPKVSLVAGIGVPDPVMGEVGRYYIVPRAGTPPPTEGEIIAFCREHLADYKVPRQIVIRSRLPLTPAGRIMKSRLRDEVRPL